MDGGSRPAIPKERRIDDRNVDWIGVVHNDINRTD